MCLMFLMCLPNSCKNERGLACKVYACLPTCLEMLIHGLAKGPLVNRTDTMKNDSKEKPGEPCEWLPDNKATAVARLCGLRAELSQECVPVDA